jgi:hypothetical protein
MDELFASHVGRVGAFIRDGCIQGVGCVSIRDCKWRLSWIFGIHRAFMPWIFIALGHIRTVLTLRPEAVPNGIVDSVVADLLVRDVLHSGALHLVASGRILFQRPS